MRILNFSLLVFSLFCLLGTATAQSYTIPMTPLSLDDLSAFKPQAGNWQLVSSVLMDRTVDVHENGNKSVKIEAGKGILINLNDEKKHDALLTAWEHGDMDIELDVMLPKGSNSGIYLQGRYEIQLFDSWGVKNAKFSDIGGIYRNWEQEKGKIYMGKAPLVNAAKASGLWQKMFIAFRAPKFDAAGQKIANARLERVTLNGVTIHENVEIPLPTGGPIENNERATGPLMIQGDHGAVAFRNITYRLYKNQKVQFDNLTYQYWDGRYEYESEYKNKTPKKTGTIKEINLDMRTQKDTFGVRYTGKINAPEAGMYYFTLVSNGGSVLNVNGKNVITNYRAWDWDPKSGQIELQAGLNDLEVFYHRHDTWRPPNLNLLVETLPISQHPLSAASGSGGGERVSPVLVHVGSEPKLLRAFIDYKGDRKLRRTHTVGVGDPSGTHYAFDNALGVLTCAWRGDFVDATPMWHDRGDGSFKPLGDVLFLSNTPQLAVLANKDAAFPTTFDATNFLPKGYKMDESTAMPVFRYFVQGVEIEDRTQPNNNVLTREVKILNNSSNTALSFKLAEGKSIEQLNNDTYLIDKKYYILFSAAEKPTLRTSNGQQELVVSMSGGGVKYSIVW
jgi:hypothetical protein